MSWQRYNPEDITPIYWIKAPEEVITQLREKGFHTGYWAEDGVDVQLRKAFAQPHNPDLAIQHLRAWISFIDREISLLSPGFATLWYPNLTKQDEALIRCFFGNRLVEIKAITTDEAYHQFLLTRWNFGVFYHVACMGNWRSVIEEQLSLLQAAGLSGIYVSFLGDDDDIEYFLGRVRTYRLSISLQFRSSSVDMFEIPAIRLIQDWAETHPDNYLLYLHTKGVSAPNDVVKIHWRRLMGHWLIQRWRENAQILRNGAEIVGVNWRHHPPTSHFPGNFWMARSSYINSLEDFSYYYRHPRHSAGNHINQWRLGAEFWLGSGSTHPRIHSHVSFNERIDMPEYWARRRPGIDGYLALCLWCKDEGAYLDEWLTYHLGLGVEHVVIIDNNSADPLFPHVRRFIASGQVTLLASSDTAAGRQCRAYAECIRNFGPQYHWIGFIDTDEFIVPKNGQSLPHLLKDYENFGGLGMFWSCFGSSGHKTKQPSVVRSFLRRSTDSFDSNDHIKTIVNTNFVLPVPAPDPHHFLYKSGYCCVDENKRPIVGGRSRPRVSEKIQLNHYILRSAEEFSEKNARGGGNSTFGTRSVDFFDLHDRVCNEVLDRSAADLFERITMGKEKESNNTRLSVARGEI